MEQAMTHNLKISLKYFLSLSLSVSLSVCLSFSLSINWFNCNQSFVPTATQERHVSVLPEGHKTGSGHCCLQAQGPEVCPGCYCR